MEKINLAASQIRKRHTMLVSAPQVANKTESNSVKTVTTSSVETWGWVPQISLICALGLLLLAFANNAGRNGEAWGEPLFWLGVITIFFPIALRITLPTLSFREGAGLVLLLGLSLYLVKVLHSPTSFTFSDEFIHWRTAIDIFNTHHLFTYNYLLPTSAFYPTLEMVTSALGSTSGLGYFLSGVILLAVARIILMLSLYYLYVEISGSVRVAGIASLLYATNSNFLFFDSQFSYESLALPLAVLLLNLQVRRQKLAGKENTTMLLIAILILACIITTHHMTSFAISTFLLLWAGVDFFLNRGTNRHANLLKFALLAFISTVTWVFLVANTLIGYLGPYFINAVSALTKLLLQEENGRQLFQAEIGESAGSTSSIWEKIVGFASVGLILVGLAFGLWQIWRKYRTNSIIFTLGLGVLAYPVAQLFRFTSKGWELANRTSEFLFVAVGFVIALGIHYVWLKGKVNYFARIAIGLYATVIFMGGIITGWPPMWRVPGPYLVESDTRSIEPKGVEAADWAYTYLGPYNRVGADRINMILMATYGEQTPSTTISRGVNPYWIIFAPKIEQDHKNLISRGKLNYLVVDQRLRQLTQKARTFYPNGSIKAAFDKFDTLPDISRIYDNGDIQIYDISKLPGSGVDQSGALQVCRWFDQISFLTYKCPGT